MKKNFTGGLSSLLGESKESNEPKATSQQPPQEPQPIPTSKTIIKTTQQGTKIGEARATFIVNEALHDKIKAIAYWERLQIKDVVDEALSGYVSSYEKKNGAVKPVPKSK